MASTEHPEHPRFAHPRPKFFTAYSFAIVTLGLFLLSWVGQFVFQVIEVRNDSAEHGQTFEWVQFWPQFLSATLENWQSEFLQLVWQAAGLAMFYFWGSSQSRESDDPARGQGRRPARGPGHRPADLRDCRGGPGRQGNGPRVRLRAAAAAGARAGAQLSAEPSE